MDLKMLSVDDVVLIHERISLDARRSDRPVTTVRGTGVTPIKDRQLLESAVARQFAGNRDELYYPTAELNAASLMFGLAKNHAFIDGNKRTALVAMLNHLDRNNVTLQGPTWREVEDVVLEVVVGRMSDRTRLRHALIRAVDHSERELRALAEWIRQNSRRLERGERRMTYNELEKLLRAHGFGFGKMNGNYVDIVKYVEETERRLLGGSRQVVKVQHIGTIGYPGGKREIAVFGVKQVRKICRLTEEHGVDSAVFYDQEMALDEIINRYRRTLRSLADK